MSGDDVKERIAPVDEVQLLRAAARDWRLTRGDLGVFSVILEHCNSSWQAFPGPTLISQRARLAVSNVKTSLRQLEALRYLSIERPGLRKKNRFTVLESPPILPRSVYRTSLEMGKRLHPRTNRARTHTQKKTPEQRPTGPAYRPATGPARVQQLGLRTGHEVAFKSPLKSQSLASPLEEQGQQEEQQLEDQPTADQLSPDNQRLREHARSVYQQAKASGHVPLMRSIERSHRHHLEGLIDDQAA